MITYTVSSTPPVAAFSGTPTSGNTPLTVAFTDASTNTPTSWYWEFGDGSSTNNTAQNPVHAYSSAGTYSVNLTATNGDGSDYEYKSSYITVSEPETHPPVAAFSGSPTSGTRPLSVTFTDASTNTPVSWSWDFGDGNTSSSQNPVHVYDFAGTFTVSLTATNGDGSDSEVKTSYITVTTPTPVPTTYPTAGPTPVAWYNNKTIFEIATLHTYSPTGVTQKCVIMRGSTDISDTVWFVYGGAHNTYNWKTKDQVKGGTYNQTQCNFPLFPGKTYYYRAASASGYGAEYNFTMTALGVQPTSTYGHYAEEFIETEGNITAAGEMIFDPYTDKWGTIFISMVIGMIFVAICLKQNSSATPAILAFIVGVPLFAMMAPEYIKATQALLMVAVAGMIYYVFARRK